MNGDEVSKVWMVTGCSGGIGLEIVKRVLQTPQDRIVALTRAPESLLGLQKEFAERVELIRCALDEPAAIRSASRTAIQRWGHVDVLVNNAGYGLTGAVADLDETELRDQFQINFFAAAQLMRETLPSMIERRSGHIVNISSVGGLVAWGGLSAYCASKFALEGFSEALHEEVREYGIKVLLIEPGAVRTRWSGSSLAESANRRFGAALVGKVREALSANAANGLDPAEVAHSVVEAVRHPPAGLRLLLGTDAVKWVRSKTNQLVKVIEAK
jgi:short-subunit dehydrogenase